jgi:hypothetical protein
MPPIPRRLYCPFLLCKSEYEKPAIILMVAITVLVLPLKPTSFLLQKPQQTV